MDPPRGMGCSETVESAGDLRPADWSEAEAYSCTPEPSAGSRSRRSGAIGRLGLGALVD